MKASQVSYNTFYVSWHEAASEAGLSREQYGNLVFALNEYCFYGREPELSGIEKALFTMAVPNIDSSNAAKTEGRKGGAPKGNRNASKEETTPLVEEKQPPLFSENNPPCENKTSNGEGEGDVNGEIFCGSPEPQNVLPEQPFPETPGGKTPGKAVVRQQSRSPPQKKGQELDGRQLALFHAGKQCFESSGKAKSIMYQDKGSTAREMKCLKLLVIRCTGIAPEMSAEFLKSVLENFKVMCNGKLKGKAVFTPRSLVTPWIWEQVIDSLPEGRSPEEEARMKDFIRGMFK